MFKLFILSIVVSLCTFILAFVCYLVSMFYLKYFLMNTKSKWYNFLVALILFNLVVLCAILLYYGGSRMLNGYYFKPNGNITVYKSDVEADLYEVLDTISYQYHSMESTFDESDLDICRLALQFILKENLVTKFVQDEWVYNTVLDYQLRDAVKCVLYFFYDIEEQMKSGIKPYFVTFFDELSSADDEVKEKVIKALRFIEPRVNTSLYKDLFPFRLYKIDVETDIYIVNSLVMYAKTTNLI